MLTNKHLSIVNTPPWKKRRTIGSEPIADKPDAQTRSFPSPSLALMALHIEGRGQYERHYDASIIQLTPDRSRLVGVINGLVTMFPYVDEL